ncbi:MULTISPECIES: hypothetical protein [Microbacterium]|uniref:hypothetical protein n=1 Tax=Microbacterium TaxID=33882 RepID=UPI001FFD81C8|nr:hypothetical protein [Microbacterium galbinum]MBQ3358730.1 hypothetical protein [Microbacterium sp.]MCK2029587.1 hypothetical protein [Microbacterium galbinum]
MTAFPALGFDPAPGNLGELEGFVLGLSTGCDSVDDALAMLNGDDDAAWTGEAAVAFRAAMSEDFRPHLVDTGSALRTSRDALSTWVTQLTGYQQRARELEDRAATAAASVSSKATAKDKAVDGADAEDADPDAVSNATTALATAQGALDDVIAEAQRLKIEVDDDAAIAAQHLVSASDTLNSYAGNAFSNFLEGAGDWLADAGEWLMDNVVPILEDILRAALPIIAILSLFIPVLGTVALVMAIALVAIDGLQALTGRGSWTDFAIGAVGLLAGGLLGVAAKTLIGPGGAVLIPSIQRMTPALAGGGTAAGTLAVTLNINMSNMVANTYWMTNTAMDAHSKGQDFVDSLFGPWQNLAERVDNTVHGNGPKTDDEL